MLLYSWFFLIIKYIYKCPTSDFLKKIIKYIIYFKYILNMVGRVGFDRFVILWLKPNPTRYKNIFYNPIQPTKP